MAPQQPHKRRQRRQPPLVPVHHLHQSLARLLKKLLAPSKQKLFAFANKIVCYLLTFILIYDSMYSVKHKNTKQSINKDTYHNE
jgi:hypothetical protein